MNRNAIIITSVGMVIGVAEALIYYNLGQNAGGKFTYRIPPRNELLKTASIVLVTSIMTAGISAFIESSLRKEEKQIA